MPTDPFDLERLRKNWGRVEEPVVVPEPRSSPPRNARKKKPRTDPYVEARALLARIRAIGLDPNVTPEAAHRAAVFPFMQRAEAIVEEMAVGTGDQSPLREELLAVLVDLEDLFDVFGMPPRRAP